MAENIWKPLRILLASWAILLLLNLWVILLFLMYHANAEMWVLVSTLICWVVFFFCAHGAFRMYDKFKPNDEGEKRVSYMENEKQGDVIMAKKDRVEDIDRMMHLIKDVAENPQMPEEDVRRYVV